MKGTWKKTSFQGGGGPMWLFEMVRVLGGGLGGRGRWIICWFLFEESSIELFVLWGESCGTLGRGKEY